MSLPPDFACWPSFTAKGGRYSNVANVLVGRRGKSGGGEANLGPCSVIASQGVSISRHVLHVQPCAVRC